MVRIEQAMVTGAVALTQRTTHRVDEGRRTTTLTGLSLSAEQHLAFGHVTRSRDLAVVVGIAGGGKSTMLGAAREVWAGQGYRVRGAALSGIATQGLEGSAGIESRTIASWEYAWNQGKEELSAHDVLVVDEAGMIGSRQLGRLVSRVQQAGAKLVLVGDAEQLQAIEAGAAFRAIAEAVGVAAITEPRRQQQEWQRQGTKELATGRSGEALHRYASAGMVHGHTTREAARNGVIAGWDAARRQSPQASQIILTHERVEVRALNEAARAVRRAGGELGPDHTVQAEAGVRAFATGDRLYFLRNERELGVKNGTLGSVERIEPGPGGARLTVRLDGAEGAGTGRAVRFDLAEYADIDHGYAATAHKSQSVTVDQAHVLATPGMDRHLTYVAMSRHRHAAQLHWGEDDFSGRLHAILGRERAKDTTLDYAETELDPVAAYAERRALAPAMPPSEIVIRYEAAAETEPAVVHDEDKADLSVREGMESPSGRRRIDDLLDHLARVAAGPTASPDLSWPANMGERIRRLENQIAQERAFRAPVSWPWDQVSAEVGTPAPMLPAFPDRPVTPEEVAAAVNADPLVRQRRFDLQYILANAYRDPVEAERLLTALEAKTGTAAVIARLAEKPGLLGRLRGRDWLANADSAVERALAKEAVTRIGSQLAKQRDAEQQAGDAFCWPLQNRRRREAVAVPGLSGKALAAVQALAEAGAAPGQTGVAPWQPRVPRPEEITWAARVAPLWAAITADTALRGELDRFSKAAQQRLPIRRGDPSDEPLSGLAVTAQTYVDTLHSAMNLSQQHPGFQAYAAAEPERQAARAAQEAEEQLRRTKERAEAARRLEAEQQETKRLLEQMRKRRLTHRPSPGPSMG